MRENNEESDREEAKRKKKKEQGTEEDVSESKPRCGKPSEGMGEGKKKSEAKKKGGHFISLQ